MSNHETAVQYIKIALAIVAIVSFFAWADRVIHLLQVIAERACL